jgi:hypothetical protein
VGFLGKRNNKYKPSLVLQLIQINMKKTFLIILVTLFVTIPIFSFGQTETKTNENNGSDKQISYTFINEYGFYCGGAFGFTGIFVNGIRFNKTQDIIGIGIGYEVDSRPSQTYNAEGGQSIPIFVNYRHYFPGKRALKPLVNIGIGTRISFWKENYYYYWEDYPYPGPKSVQHVTAGLYGTVAAGFKVKAFSFTSGFCLKSWNGDFYGGVEVKVGFTF